MIDPYDITTKHLPTQWILLGFLILMLLFLLGSLCYNIEEEETQRLPTTLQQDNSQQLLDIQKGTPKEKGKQMMKSWYLIDLFLGHMDIVLVFLIMVLLWGALFL